MYCMRASGRVCKHSWVRPFACMYAYVLTFARIQWQAESARVLIDDAGTKMDLLHVSPAAVTKMAGAAAASATQGHPTG